MNVPFGILLILISWSTSLFAQSAQAEYQQGIILQEQEKKSEAALLFEKARTSAKAEADTTTFLKANLSLGNQAIRNGDYQEARQIFSNGIAYAEGEKWIQHPKFGDHWHKLGVALYLEGKLEEAIVAYQQALVIRKDLYGENHLDVARSYHNIGTSYERLKEHNRAIDYLQKGLDIRKKHDVPDDQAYSYLRLGANYVEKEDYDKGLEYYRPSLQIYQEQYGAIDYDVAELHNVMGIAYFLKKEYGKAIEAYQKALEVYEHPDIADIEGQTNGLNNLGGAYFESGEIKKALSFYERSALLNQELGSDNLDGLADNYTNIGLCYNRLGKFKKARYFLERALKTSQSIYGSTHPEHAYHYDNLADTYAEVDQYDRALELNQLGIQQLVPDFKPSDFTNTPEIESENIWGSKRLLLTLLANKATYLAVVEEYDQQAVLDCYSKADALIDQMRQDQSAKGSKLFWTEEALPIYEKAVASALILKDLDQAFYFMEKSKSILLLEALKESDARKFTGIPTDLLEREKSLKTRIGEQEQALFASRINQDSSVSVEAQQDLLASRQEYEQLMKKLESDHPDYFQMKYDFSSIDRDRLAEVRPQETGLIEYLVGDEHLFIYYQLDSDDGMLDLPIKPELSEMIQGFRESIYGYYLSDERSDKLYRESAERYADLGFELYQYLIEPLNAFNLPEHLIIIPDGVLGYLPFDALLTHRPEQATRFKSHPYLLHSHQISYSYSASLLQEMLSDQTQQASKGLLAFAPSFSGETQGGVMNVNRSVLNPLMNNQAEVKAIKALLGGDLKLGEDATEAQFRKLAPSYRILHFATHGKANDTHADYSFLAFAEIADSIENEFLFVHDLYNMELNAELAVLSACETGTGKLYRGEGIMSLARGFSYAGVPSIVTTLWSVNDAKTSELMQGFYQSLKQGKNKAQALQDSKLGVISNGSDDFESHPFYWSGAILIGNPQAIHLQEFPYPEVFGVLLVFLLFLGLRIRRRSRKK